MGKKLYVGNLDYETGVRQLEEMFGAYGTVVSAQVITERDTGRSKGFGFVEMGAESEATAAIAALNGKDIGGRSLTVSEARPQGSGGAPAGRGGFRGGRRGGGGRY
jgi:RNA recognition motif-containing protein